MTERREAGAVHAATIHIVQDIIDYIEENLMEPLTPAGIAARFSQSVSAIGRLFTLVCDMPMMEYARNRRLSLAGRELLGSDIRVIDLALKYGYETPEAFARAFSRLYGFPPSFVRRVYPEVPRFEPLIVNIEIRGGWLTDLAAREQEKATESCYHESITTERGMDRMNREVRYRVSIGDMTYKEDWRILLSLARALDESGVPFKVDGATMVFAHGLEFKLEKICLTFKWGDERRIHDFFGHAGYAIPYHPGFKYFDVLFQGMKVRCMFYGDCPGDGEDAFLYRDTDQVEVDGQVIRVQSLQFYLENGDRDREQYAMVEAWMNR